MCLVHAWKTGLWARAMDHWLFLFIESGVGSLLAKLLLARLLLAWLRDDRGVRERRGSSLGARAALLVKELGAMDPWLFLFSEGRVGLLLAKLLLTRLLLAWLRDDRGVEEKRGSFWGARAALLIKGLDGASPSCLAASALICSVLLLFFMTFISAYWLFLSSRPISVSNSLIQVASFAARVSATYSASVDDKPTVACFLEHKLTGPPFSIKMNPDVKPCLYHCKHQRSGHALVSLSFGLCGL